MVGSFPHTEDLSLDPKIFEELDAEGHVAAEELSGDAVIHFEGATPADRNTNALAKALTPEQAEEAIEAAEILVNIANLNTAQRLGHAANAAKKVVEQIVAKPRPAAAAGPVGKFAVPAIPPPKFAAVVGPSLAGPAVIPGHAPIMHCAPAFVADVAAPVAPTSGSVSPGGTRTPKIFKEAFTNRNKKYLEIARLPSEKSGRYGDVQFSIEKTPTVFNTGNSSVGNTPSIIVVKSMKCLLDHTDPRLPFADLNHECDFLRAITAEKNKGIIAARFFSEVLDSDTVNDYTGKPRTLWYAMPLVRGATLHYLMKDLTWPARKAGLAEAATTAFPRILVPSMVYQIISAMRWLHMPNASKPWTLLHNDFHSNNVMIDFSNPINASDGVPFIAGLEGPIPRIKIIDFGLALVKHYHPLDAAQCEKSDVTAGDIMMMLKPKAHEISPEHFKAHNFIAAWREELLKLQAHLLAFIFSGCHGEPQDIRSAIRRKRFSHNDYRVKNSGFSYISWYSIFGALGRGDLGFAEQEAKGFMECASFLAGAQDQVEDVAKGWVRLEESLNKCLGESIVPGEREIEEGIGKWRVRSPGFGGA